MGCAWEAGGSARRRPRVDARKRIAAVRGHPNAGVRLDVRMLAVTKHKRRTYHPP
jgi:hypothetical protein